MGSHHCLSKMEGRGILWKVGGEGDKKQKESFKIPQDSK